MSSMNILQCGPEEDLNAHIGYVHSAPEKEHAPDQVAELLLTPFSGQRKEMGTMPSPPCTLSAQGLPRISRRSM